MTKRVELDDDGDEWIDINNRVADAVVTRAMTEDQTFGQAFAEYVAESLTGDDE